MTDNATLIEISAFSALSGAILTQVLTGLFAYVGDKRKSKLELSKQYRDKQIEVAEHFYFVTGETMAVLRKSIEHWKDRNKARSGASVEFFNKEIKKLDAYMDKLNAENWKHNLISLYFNISLSHNKLIAANTKSHALYLNLLDIADQFKKANEVDKNMLLGKYHEGVFDLCSQYDDIYKMLESDMLTVKTALLNSFEIT
ncbi:hypothetical protein [Mucilaginibacter sp.]